MRRRILTAAAAFIGAAFCASASFAQGERSGGSGGERGGIELLRVFLEKTPAAQITLSREVWDADGEKISEGAARLMIRRPDKFRLEHDGPEALLIVSDGKTVWTYESDLAQAIRRPYASARGMGALAMLAGDAPEAHFQLSAAPLADENNIRWVSAVPRVDSSATDADGGVDGVGVTVRAGFSSDGELHELRMLDAFGGVVRLIVDGLSRAVPADSVFEFNPPAGTDIVADDGG